MPALTVHGVGKVFRTPDRAWMRALQDVSFAADHGELVCLVGPSGCGKSTLLQIVGGLLLASEGRVLLDGRAVAGPPKQMVVLFQQYTKSLLPWRTAEGNVLFAIENLDVPPRERRSRVTRNLAVVGLAGFERYYPHQLSGGMQQRVAIARALAREPEILLMDEPFSSLDAMTRAELQDLLLSLWQRFKKTVVFVTHDIEEAVYLSSKVVVLSARPGRVLAELANELPYPRDQLATREDARFLRLRRRIHQMIGGSVDGAL